MSAQPVPIQRAPARVLFIDNLRILLTALVILHHLAIGYGSAGDWYYDENGPITTLSTILLTLFVAINQSFFMGFFLLIGSYMIPGSLARKEAARFVLDRLKRLGIPILLYTFVLSPVLIAILRADRGQPFDLFQAPGFGLGPMWFVETLLIFSLGYVAWHTFAPRTLTPRAINAPGNFVIALFAFVLGVITFVVRIWFPIGWWLEPIHLQIAHFPQYIALFVIGIIAFQRDWFNTLGNTSRRVWLWSALTLAPAFLAIGIAGGALEGNLDAFTGGVHWQSFVTAIWEQVMGIAVIITLLVSFRERLNRQNNLAQTLAADAYAVFTFHPLVIVPLALAFRDIAIEMGVKFIFIAPLAVIACFIVGHTIRKIPGAQKIF
jgi:hypothetical protein